MPNFKPNEIKIKVLDNSVVVDAEHEEQQEDDGHHVYRKITRRFQLPHSADLDKFTSTLSDDGTLIIKTTKKPLETVRSFYSFPFCLLKFCL